MKQLTPVKVTLPAAQWAALEAVSAMLDHLEIGGGVGTVLARAREAIAPHAIIESHLLSTAPYEQTVYVDLESIGVSVGGDVAAEQITRLAGVVTTSLQSLCQAGLVRALVCQGLDFAAHLDRRIEVPAELAEEYWTRRSRVEAFEAVNEAIEAHEAALGVRAIELLNAEDRAELKSHKRGQELDSRRVYLRALLRMVANPPAPEGDPGECPAHTRASTLRALHACKDAAEREIEKILAATVGPTELEACE